MGLNFLLISDNQQQEYYSNLIGCLVDVKVEALEKNSENLYQVDYSKYHMVIRIEDAVSFIWLRKVKKLFPISTLVIFSDQPTIAKAVRAVRLGAEDYLREPIEAKDFKKILKRTLSPDHKKLDEMNPVYTDETTGLFNLRYLYRILDHEIAISVRSRGSFALLFIDVDNFKAINDNFGHVIGTKLLFEIADQIKKMVRNGDSVFRYGGDEFVAILSLCDLSTAGSVAERIRNSIQDRIFIKKDNINIHLTVSIGIALYPDHSVEKFGIIESADQAMYEAKRLNRNRVSIYRKETHREWKKVYRDLDLN